MSKIITVDVNSELWKQGAREWELLKGKQALFNFLTCKTFNNYDKSIIDKINKELKDIQFSFNKTLNAIFSLYRPSNFSKNCHFDINFYKGEITFDE